VAEIVYALCALTSIASALLLLRGYARTRVRLLLWSGLCFVGLTLNNVLLFVDKVVVPETNAVMGVEFGVWRSVCALVALVVLLMGLIWDSD
jgi:hypothetical protein